MRPHTHNMYLQIWYELGAIGSMLFVAAGLAVLRLDRLPVAAQPAMFVTFAAAAAAA